MVLKQKGANLKVLKYGSCHAVDKFEFKTCAFFEKGAEVSIVLHNLNFLLYIFYLLLLFEKVLKNKYTI